MLTGIERIGLIMAKVSGNKLHKDGVALFRKKKYKPALEKFEKALDAAGDNQALVAMIHNDIGAVHIQLSNFEAAREALTESLAGFEDLDDEKGRAMTYGNYASLLENEGNFEEAVQAYKESATIFEELGEGDLAMYAWQAISRLRIKQKQYIAAIGAYEEGIDNMPENSFKRKMLQNLLRVPGNMMGGIGSTGDKDDNKDKS